MRTVVCKDHSLLAPFFNVALYQVYFKAMKAILIPFHILQSTLGSGKHVKGLMAAGSRSDYPRLWMTFGILFLLSAVTLCSTSHLVFVIHCFYGKGLTFFS